MDIKPCPFCGGEAELQELPTAPDRCLVKCLKCWAKSVFVEWCDKERAIESWNQRAALKACEGE